MANFNDFPTDEQIFGVSKNLEDQVATRLDVAELGSDIDEIKQYNIDDENKRLKAERDTKNERMLEQARAERIQNKQLALLESLHERLNNLQAKQDYLDTYQRETLLPTIQEIKSAVEPNKITKLLGFALMAGIANRTGVFNGISGAVQGMLGIGDPNKNKHVGISRGVQKTALAATSLAGSAISLATTIGRIPLKAAKHFAGDRSMEGRFFAGLDDIGATIGNISKGISNRAKAVKAGMDEADGGKESVTRRAMRGGWKGFKSGGVETIVHGGRKDDPFANIVKGIFSPFAKTKEISERFKNGDPLMPESLVEQVKAGTGDVSEKVKNTVNKATEMLYEALGKTNQDTQETLEKTKSFIDQLKETGLSAIDELKNKAKEIWEQASVSKTVGAATIELNSTLSKYSTDEYEKNQEQRNKTKQEQKQAEAEKQQEQLKTQVETNTTLLKEIKKLLKQQMNKLTAGSDDTDFILGDTPDRDKSHKKTKKGKKPKPVKPKRPGVKGKILDVAENVGSKLKGSSWLSKAGRAVGSAAGTAVSAGSRLLSAPLAAIGAGANTVWEAGKGIINSEELGYGDGLTGAAKGLVHGTARSLSNIADFVTFDIFNLTDKFDKYTKESSLGKTEHWHILQDIKKDPELLKAFYLATEGADQKTINKILESFAARLKDNPQLKGDSSEEQDQRIKAINDIAKNTIEKEKAEGKTTKWYNPFTWFSSKEDKNNQKPQVTTVSNTTETHNINQVAGVMQEETLAEKEIDNIISKYNKQIQSTSNIYIKTRLENQRDAEIKDKQKELNSYKRIRGALVDLGKKPTGLTKEQEASWLQIQKDNYYAKAYINKAKYAKNEAEQKKAIDEGTKLIKKDKDSIKAAREYIDSTPELKEQYNKAEDKYNFLLRVSRLLQKDKTGKVEYLSDYDTLENTTIASYLKDGKDLTNDNLEQLVHKAKEDVSSFREKNKGLAEKYDNYIETHNTPSDVSSDISKALFNTNKQYKGLNYQFGGKQLNDKSTGIDCSGYIAASNIASWDNITINGTKLTDEQKKELKSNLMTGSASSIVKKVGDMGGVKVSGYGSELKREDFGENDIIGEDNGDKGWDSGRYNGIDHITQVVRNPDDNQLYVVESRSKAGVSIRTLDDYLSKKKKTKLYVVSTNKAISNVLAKADTTKQDNNTVYNDIVTNASNSVQVARKEDYNTDTAVSPNKTIVAETKPINIQAPELDISNLVTKEDLQAMLASIPQPIVQAPSNNTSIDIADVILSENQIAVNVQESAFISGLNRG